ncbi:hypothetical protein IL252_01625 [Halomicrobium sp. IBSBa]|uniref:hypothetical protein n=1 Tax=Halomicrobium sp. IBSBa TaxID=2778916 RepID=UPI001ABF9467|nr:hypothetical protein [Halomicrobium sp. IBSBa]MBO4246512.1 hypothetical protein [Halomicrobium sp. IBSBa]
MTASNQTLLSWMVREEWRLHSELFGGRRFAGFPLAIGALTALGTALLAATGTQSAAVLAGLHALVALFGLQVGTIGLVGRDALRDVLGDVTLLLFSARTLPLSMKRLLGLFLVKEVLYYSGLFVTPVLAGFGVVAVGRGMAPATVALAWLTVTLAFALGATASLALAALAARNALAVGVALAAGVVAVVATGTDPVALTPYRLFTDPSVAGVVVAVVPPLALGGLGIALFEPTEDDGEDGRHRRLDRLLVAVAPDGLTRRPLLAVARSAGSVWKVLFSMGVLFGVTALVLRQVTAATGIEPGVGIAFGTLLGLGGFTTYSWVTQFGDPREYLRYPVSYDAVFRGALRAYLLLSVGASLLYLAVALLWYPLAEVALGAVVQPLVALYVFGVTAAVTGLSPNELLFDTPRFALFGAALAALATPLVVAALAVRVDPLLVRVVAVAIALVGAVVGLVLTRRAGPRWTSVFRE